MNIGVIGGTGQLGKATAKRLAAAGHAVTIGSRSVQSAQDVAAEIGASGSATYADAASDKDIVIVAVPFAAQAEALAAIGDTIGEAIVVDTTVPLVPPKAMRVQLPEAGSAAMAARSLLGPDVRLVSAFHNVAAHKLITDEPVGCDVLVFGDEVDARNTVIGLVEDMRMRGLSGGALTNSAAAEALTSVLIYMNRTYGADGAGIRFTALPAKPAT